MNNEIDVLKKIEDLTARLNEIFGKEKIYPYQYLESACMEEKILFYPKFLFSLSNQIH